MKNNLIGISGRIGSGKDTVGNIINYLCWKNSVEKGIADPQTYTIKDFIDGRGRETFEIKKFADKLKQRVALTWGIDRIKLEDRGFKNSIIPQLGITWRKIMQLEGEKMREINKDYWVNALFSDYSDFYNSMFSVRNGYKEPKNKWIITDVRFPNEVKAIKDRGGIVIRVNRNTSELSNHESETALDNAKFDYIIDNNSDIRSLIEKVKNLDII